MEDDTSNYFKSAFPYKGRVSAVLIIKITKFDYTAIFKFTKYFALPAEIMLKPKACKTLNQPTKNVGHLTVHWTSSKKYFSACVCLHVTSEDNISRAVNTLSLKVIATRPDGTPATDEVIEVSVNDRSYGSEPWMLKKTFTTDKEGKVRFSIEDVPTNISRFSVMVRVCL